MSDKQPEKFPAHELLLNSNLQTVTYKKEYPRPFFTNEYSVSIADLKTEFNTLLTDRQADEKLIRELLNILMISEPICWRNENIVSRHQHAIARAQTRLGGEAPFETDNQKLIEDM